MKNNYHDRFDWIGFIAILISIMLIIWCGRARGQDAAIAPVAITLLVGPVTFMTNLPTGTPVTLSAGAWATNYSITWNSPVAPAFNLDTNTAGTYWATISNSFNGATFDTEKVTLAIADTNAPVAVTNAPQPTNSAAPVTNATVVEPPSLPFPPTNIVTQDDFMNRVNCSVIITTVYAAGATNYFTNYVSLQQLVVVSNMLAHFHHDTNEFEVEAQWLPAATDYTGEYQTSADLTNWQTESAFNVSRAGTNAWFPWKPKLNGRPQLFIRAVSSTNALPQ